MKQLNQNFKVVQFIPISSVDVDTTGDTIDMRQTDMFAYDTALVLAEIGGWTNGAENIVLTVQESDDPLFATADDIERKEVAQNTSEIFQIERRKRYLRVAVGLNSAEGAQILVNGLLWNASIPFPIDKAIDITQPESS